jgi:hypothetical protein
MNRSGCLVVYFVEFSSEGVRPGGYREVPLAVNYAEKSCPFPCRERFLKNDRNLTAEMLSE